MTWTRFTCGVTTANCPLALWAVTLQPRKCPTASLGTFSVEVRDTVLRFRIHL